MDIRISKSLESILAQTVAIAMKSEQKMKHGACLFVSYNKISSYGYNSDNRTKIGKYYSPSNHAEKSCLSQSSYLKNDKKKKVSMMVVRVNSFGKLCNSRPCDDCIKYIKQYKQIERIYYSDERGIIVMERVRNMSDKCHKSHCTRRFCSNGWMRNY